MLSRKGQYTVEVTVLFAFVSAALFTMYNFVKNCKQGDVRAAAETIGDPIPGDEPSTYTYMNIHSEESYDSTEDDNGKESSSSVRQLNTYTQRRRGS